VIEGVEVVQVGEEEARAAVVGARGLAYACGCAYEGVFARAVACLERAAGSAGAGQVGAKDGADDEAREGDLASSHPRTRNEMKTKGN